MRSDLIVAIDFLVFPDIRQKVLPVRGAAKELNLQPHPTQHRVLISYLAGLQQDRPLDLVVSQLQQMPHDSRSFMDRCQPDCLRSGMAVSILPQSLGGIVLSDDGELGDLFSR